MGLTSEGRIRSSITGSVIATDTTSDVVEDGFPATLMLKRFNWHASLGDLPGLIDARVGDVPVTLNITRGSFPAVSDAVVVLRKQ